MVDIKWIKREWTIEELTQGITDGVIDLHPSVQRNENVWPEKMQANYIRTLTVCNIPFAIYAYSDGKRKNGRVIKHIWDGLQRLSICYKYVNNTLDCKTLKVTPFKDLPEEAQQKILATEVTLIDAGLCDEDTIAMLFATMNTNGCPLNDQEIRDSAFRGPLTKTVALISERQRGALEDVFTSRKINRKQDKKFLLSMILAMSDGRHLGQAKDIDEFVRQHGEDFSEDLISKLETALKYYHSLKLPRGSMWRKVSNSYTLIIELAKFNEENYPDIDVMRQKLLQFQINMDNRQPGDMYTEYNMLCIQGINNSVNKKRRGEILTSFFEAELPKKEVEQLA